MIQIDLQNLFDREADPLFDFEPKPATGFESKTENRGHEPDPKLDPRVEDKKFTFAACRIVLKTNVFVTKHVQKLLAIHVVAILCGGPGPQGV